MRILVFTLCLSLSSPCTGFSLRPQSDLAGLEEVLHSAGAEEQADPWDAAQSETWRVFSGPAAALLAEQVGWRSGLRISYLGGDGRRRARVPAPWISSDQALRWLKDEPGSALMVENRQGNLGLVDLSAGPLFLELSDRALKEVRIEPLTNGIVDREWADFPLLLKELDLKVSSVKEVPGLRVRNEWSNFGRLARDPGTGKIVGFIAARRGDDVQESSRSNIAYITYNVVDKEWRGRGVGRLLFESVMSAAAESRDPPVQSVIWESFPGSSTRRFYDRMGGREVLPTAPFAVAARVGRRVAYQLELPPPSAGAEEAREFESLELFMNRYAEVLAKQGRLGWIEALKERNLPARVWVVPAAAAADQRQVTAYVTSEAPEEQAEWELAAAERLNREKDRPKETFFDVKRLAHDLEFEKASVIIRQAGGIKPIGSHPPVITLSILPDLEELRPSWVYSVAVNESLWGRELGSVLGVLTFQDEAGRWIHAIFA